MAIIRSSTTTDELVIDPTSKAGRVTLYDTAGNVIEAIAGTDGSYHLTAAIQQKVYISTKNSLSGTIAGSAYWEGTSESTLGVAALQINTFVSKTHRVTVYQSMDDSNWDISDSWDEPANYGTARTVQATAAYYKVRVLNLTAAEATAARVQSALCPTIEALPRSLTSGGNLRVSVQAEWQSTKRTLGIYTVSTFRTLGAAAATQNLFTIENPAASTVAVAIRSLDFTQDSLAELTTVAPQIKVSKPTSLPTGGTALTAAKYQTAFPAAVAICRGGTASDGGGATAITATAAATLWAKFLDRYIGTDKFYHPHPVYTLLPDVGADLRQIILVPGESLLVQGVTAIAATTHMVVNCGWLEYQYL
jgi:hypothetical protein